MIAFLKISTFVLVFCFLGVPSFARADWSLCKKILGELAEFGHSITVDPTRQNYSYILDTENVGGILVLNETVFGLPVLEIRDMGVNRTLRGQGISKRLLARVLSDHHPTYVYGRLEHTNEKEFLKAWRKLGENVPLYDKSDPQLKERNELAVKETPFFKALNSLGFGSVARLEVSYYAKERPSDPLEPSGIQLILKKSE